MNSSGTTAVRGLALDLDGTLIRGEQALPGVVEAVATLRARGLRIVFCTQDSVHPPKVAAERLAHLGFGATATEVICGGWFAAGQLAGCYPGAAIYAVCGPALKETFFDLGMTVLDPAHAAEAKVVFVGRDPDLAPEAITAACRAIWAGAAFYAFGRDRLLPVERRFAPGAGAVVAAIEFATQSSARVLGKPSKAIGEATLRRLGSSAAETVFVGDSLETDIEVGAAVGARRVLVLSGATGAEEAAQADGARRPEAVLPSVADLPRWLDEAAR